MFTSLVFILICLQTLVYGQPNEIDISIVITINNVKTEFFILPEEVDNFEEAIEGCESFDATPARVDSINQYDLISNSVNNVDFSFFVGLRRLSLPETFEFIDGNVDKSFFAEPFVFPWKEDQPETGAVAVKENCVGWTDFGENKPGWFDAVCSDVHFGLCRLPCENDSSELSVDSIICLSNQIGITTTPSSFKDVEQTCRDLGGALVSVSTVVEYNSIAILLQNVTRFTSVWIGVKRELSLTNPLLFDFVDGEGGIKDFFQTNGEFPWLTDKPDNAIGDEDCVEWQTNNVNLWDDVSCNSPNRVLCRRVFVEEPTLPTMSPSTFPTNFVSLKPTFAPSKLPTFSPSLNPSKFPTDNPTSSPTIFPTDNPTLSPTVFSIDNIPTKNPSTEIESNDKNIENEVNLGLNFLIFGSLFGLFFILFIITTVYFCIKLRKIKILKDKKLIIITKLDIYTGEI